MTENEFVFELSHTSFDIVWGKWWSYSWTFFLRVIDSFRNKVAQFQNWKGKADYDLVSFNSSMPSRSDILVFSDLTSSITKNRFSVMFSNPCSLWIKYIIYI